MNKNLEFLEKLAELMEEYSAWIEGNVESPLEEYPCTWIGIGNDNVNAVKIDESLFDATIIRNAIRRTLETENN